MRTSLLCAGATLVLTLGVVRAQPRQITLPPDTSKLRPSALAGYAIAQQKCGICHSADYVSFQPPDLTQAQWTAEMTKMRQAYGAPIDDDEIRSLGAYLAVAYGSARATDPAVIDASPPGPMATTETGGPATAAAQQKDTPMATHAAGTFNHEVP